MKEMLKICEDYASDPNIIFNAKKSKLMHFGRNKMNIKNTISMANGCTIDYVEQCVHLGTIISENIRYFMISICMTGGNLLISL